jgi:hypothetical protein
MLHELNQRYPDIVVEMLETPQHSFNLFNRDQSTPLLKKSPIGQKLDFTNHPYLCKGLKILKFLCWDTFALSIFFGGL